MGNKIKIRLQSIDQIKSFLSTVRGFISDVDLMTSHAKIDAKSMLGVFALNLDDDTYVQIVSDNTEEIRQFDAAMEEFI